LLASAVEVSAGPQPLSPDTPLVRRRRQPHVPRPPAPAPSANARPPQTSFVVPSTRPPCRSLSRYVDSGRALSSTVWLSLLWSVIRLGGVVAAAAAGPSLSAPMASAAVTRVEWHYDSLLCRRAGRVVLVVAGWWRLPPPASSRSRVESLSASLAQHRPTSVHDPMVACRCAGSDTALSPSWLPVICCLGR